MSQVEHTMSSELDTTGVLAYRMPRVNLLPPEIEEARRLKRTQVGLALSLVVVVAAIAGANALQAQDRKAAQRDLAVVQSQTAALNAEQTKYADVPRTISAIDNAETARQTAMAKDVEWYRTLTDFSLVVPSNVWFTTLTIRVAGVATAAGAAPSVATADPNAVASVTVEGGAIDHPDVASWLDVLSRQPSMSEAYFSDATRTTVGTKSIVKFVSTASVTNDALSHRYDRKQG